MGKRGKRYIAAAATVDADRVYDPVEALLAVRGAATAKFDETVELHLRTGLDGRHADQQIRGSVTLPHGLGREQKVVVFAEGEAASLDYWRLTGGEPAGEMRAHDRDIDVLVEAAETGLCGLIEAFGSRETPYLAVPDPDLAPAFDDYAHLARIKEWSS